MLSPNQIERHLKNQDSKLSYENVQNANFRI